MNDNIVIIGAPTQEIADKTSQVMNVIAGMPIDEGASVLVNCLISGFQHMLQLSDDEVLDEICRFVQSFKPPTKEGMN